MSIQRLVLGSRGSALALAQAERVRAQLKRRFPAVTFDLKIIKATADQQPDAPLVALSGEGIFVKELEQALRRHEIDAAVHSCKDIPLDLAEDMAIATMLQREDPRDALIAKQGDAIKRLPRAAKVATSSLRRRSQLLRLRPDVEIEPIRGNVDTRLRKLREQPLDALVMASCGLDRLGLGGQITQRVPLDEMLPEPGQGAIAVEIRRHDQPVAEIVSVLNHADTYAAIAAERATLHGLGGGCRVPIGVYAELKDGQLHVRAIVLNHDGSRFIQDSISGVPDKAEALGMELANKLRSQGAEELLARA